MAKKFEWDSEQEIGEIVINEKKKIGVSFTSLSIEREEEPEERWYVSLTTKQNYKKKGSPADSSPTWNITKNATFPLDKWHEIVELVEENLE